MIVQPRKIAAQTTVAQGIVPEKGRLFEIAQGFHAEVLTLPTLSENAPSAATTVLMVSLNVSTKAPKWLESLAN